MTKSYRNFGDLSNNSVVVDLYNSKYKKEENISYCRTGIYTIRKIDAKVLKITKIGKIYEVKILVNCEGKGTHLTNFEFKHKNKIYIFQMYGELINKEKVSTIFIFSFKLDEECPKKGEVIILKSNKQYVFKCKFIGLKIG